MSVVNKMLRDLDSRRADGRGTDRAGTLGLARGVAAVADLAPAPRRLRAWPVAGVLAALLVAVASLGGWWSLQQPVPPLDRAAPAVAVVRAPSASSMTAASAAAPQSPVLHQPSNQPVPVAATLALPVIATPPRDPSELRMETVLKNLPKERPDVATPTSSVSAPTPVERLAPVRVLPTAVAEAPVAAGLARRQIAAAELVEQAQRLWNAGSRDSAMTLLRDAALLAERDHGEGAQRNGSPVLTSLVRELIRMELAEGRVSQALERLVRLEGVLAGEADLWALRGNAAQRLGRHRESAEAYLAALKLRPDQPRWMLGAAVSLAADGQTQAAASWAQSARERGALTPEVAAYLRQLGVITTEF